MSYRKTADPEIKLDDRTGYYYYRGSPIKGGKRRLISLHTKDFKAAKAAKAKLLGQLVAGTPVAKDQVSFKQAAEELLAEQKTKAPVTYRSAFSALQSMTPFFENTFMSRITKDTWKKYVEYNEKKSPGRQLVSDRKHLLMMLNRLAKADRLGGAVPELPIPEYEVESKRVFSADEIDRLLVVAPSHYQGIILLQYYMGLTPSEAVGLKWSRIDIERGIINLTAEDTRTKEPRTIAMNKRCAEWLRTCKQLARFGEVYLSPGRKDSEPIQRMQKTWERICERANIPSPNSMSCLRHSFLTTAADKVRAGIITSVNVCTYTGVSQTYFERNYLSVKAEDAKALADIMNE